MKSIDLILSGATLVGLCAWAGAVSAADAAAGKAKFDAVCSECHEAADFEGKDAASLTDQIKKIVSGQTKHKKALKLTDAEIADLAAHLAP